MSNKGMKELREQIDKYIAKEGLTMHKMIQAPHYGLFSSSDAVYDTRNVNSYKMACELSDEGFTLDREQDIGVIVLNAIFYEKDKDN